MRNITTVSVGRSDYNITKSLYNILSKEKNIFLNLIAVGAHFSKQYGYSYQNIDKSFFNKIFKIKFNLSYNNEVSQNKSISKIIYEAGEYFKKNKVDLLLILGDRFEMLSVAIAAMNFRIPIAHIHGGELSLGAIDDSIRHSISKLSHIHFVTHNKYRKRLIQLGEEKKNIYVTGSLSNDRLDNLKYISKKKLEIKYKFKFRKKNILVTYHPETLDGLYSSEQILELLEALKYYNLNHTILYTSPNNDVGSKNIIKKIKEICKKKENHYFIKTTKNDDYYSLIKNFDILVGNSSSGIIEAPYFNKPNINVGHRQDGREKAVSNIDCSANKKEIIKSISKGLSNKFNDKIKNMKNPYYKKNSNNILLEKIVSIDLKEIIKKEFIDLN